MGRVNIRNIKTGEAKSIPEDALGAALHTGEWEVETPGQAGARAVTEGTRQALVKPGWLGQVEAALYAAGRGATLGGTDVIAGALGDAEKVQALREAFPDTSTGFEIGGAAAPALLSGGTSAGASVARALPAGRAAAIGTSLAKRGAGKGIVKETAAGALGGAAEGAAVGAGQYVSEVALTDKELSAEGFLGAAAGGGMWGGIPGGALGFTSGALTSAKRLFAKSDVTEQAAKAAEREAVAEIDAALKDVDELEATARAKVREHRKARTEVDPAAAAHAEQIRAEKLAREQARTAEAQAKAAAAGSRAEAAALRVDKLKAKGKSAPATETPPGRGAIDDAGATPAPSEVAPAPPLEPVADPNLIRPVKGARTATPAADLEATLAESAQRLQAGEPIEALTAQARGVTVDPLDRARAAAERLGRDRGGKILLSDLRREMGMEPAEFQAWLRATEKSGDVELTRLDLRGQLSPEELATLQSEALIHPLTGSESNLARFSPRTAAVDVETAIDDAIADLSPEARTLRDRANEVAEAKRGVRDWIANQRGRADEKRAKLIAEGKLSRTRDVEHVTRPGAVSDGAEVEGIRRDSVSRMRRPYTDLELEGRSLANPTFRDLGDQVHGSPAAMTARDDLAERILAGRTDPANLERETLRARDGGLELVGERATGRDILGAITRQNRDLNPEVVEALRDRLGVPRQSLDFDVSEVADVGANAPDISTQIGSALRGRLDLPDDVPVAIPAITRLERAEADLVEALGDMDAPPGSVRRAAAHREAQAAHVEREAAADAIQAEAIGEEMAGEVVKEQARKGFLGRATDVAAALDVMASLGVPGLPSGKDIPGIGPLLSLFLKGRAAMAVWRRLGGKIPATADTEIASKAAQTRDRVRAAVHSVLDIGARGARRARPGTASVAAILGERLFADEREGKHRADPAEKPAEVWAKRSRELQQALQPGAMARSVRARVPTGDPDLLQQITDTALRAAEYLDRKMPRPPPGMEFSREKWAPPPSERATFARIVEATRDPAAVLERAIVGDVSVEAIEAIRAVYPRLYAEAQTEMLSILVEHDDIPYRRRQQICQLFELPIDPTADPAFCAKQQEGFAPPPPTPPPAPAMPPAPSPAIVAPVDVSTGMMLPEQRT